MEDKRRVEFVYCIHDGQAVKVGRARNVVARAKMLQTGNPRRLAPLFAAGFPCGMAAQVEQHLLSHFRANKLLGEWLDVAPELVLSRLMVWVCCVVGTKLIAYSEHWKNQADTALLFEQQARRSH